MVLASRQLVARTSSASALAIALGVVSCGPAPPASLPVGDPAVPAPPTSTSASATSPPPDAAVAQSSAAPLASASAAPPSIIPPAPPPLAPDGPFAALFTKDKRVAYIVTDEVDTHDARPGKNVLRRSGRVFFTVKTVEPDAGTWLAEGEWAPAAPNDDAGLDGGSPPASWRLRGERLELGNDGDHEALVSASELRGAKAAVCHRNEGKGMYGETRREICFDVRGLVRYSEENLQGPRHFSVVRARR